MVTAALVLAGATLWAQAPASSPEREFLTRPRRLTVEGRRAGEGYWSKDGKKLTFQSEREPGNPFYQIYLMDMASGDVTRVSPGMGKTTCSFINPETNDILFASTHHDPTSKQQQDDELAFRASGKERRYSWDYDPEMELYVRARRRARIAGSPTRAATTPKAATRPTASGSCSRPRARRTTTRRRRPRRSSSRPTRASSPRSTSCAPTPTAPG
jgi:hypothetical protein